MVDCLEYSHRLSDRYELSPVSLYWDGRRLVSSTYAASDGHCIVSTNEFLPWPTNGQSDEQ